MENLSFGMLIVPIAIVILIVIAQWKIYEKAGQPGWAIFVPIYSAIVLMRIIRKPWYFLFVLLIPLVGMIWVTNLLSKSFGKGTGFTLGLLFLPYIFYPILAFDKSIVYIYNKNNEMDSIGRE